MLLLLIPLSLVDCATSGKETKPIIVDYSCHWLRPIYISKNDSLTAETARQILDLNETIEKVCPDF